MLLRVIKDDCGVPTACPPSGYINTLGDEGEGSPVAGPDTQEHELETGTWRYSIPLCGLCAESASCLLPGGLPRLWRRPGIGVGHPMSGTDPPPRDGPVPACDLTCSYDDAVDPSEVTVFDPGSSSLTTAWITIDISDAIRLEAMR